MIVLDEMTGKPFALSRRRMLQTSACCSALLLASCKKSSQSVTLTIGDQKGGLQTLLEVSGQLANLDYAIKWAQFGAAAPLFEAMNAGAIDAGIAGDAPFVFFLASKPSVQAIAALNYTSSAEQANAILVRSDSGFKTIRDLIGKRVAVVRGSSGQYVVLAALQQADLPLDAVNFTYLLPSDGMTALLNGGVDAWASWEPYIAIGELHNGLLAINLPTGLVQGLGFIVATNAAIQTKQAALQDFLARFGKARDWIVSHSSDYATAFAKDTGVPLDVAQAYVANAAYDVVPIDDGRISSVQKLTDLYAAAELLPQTFPVDFAFDKTFGSTS
jgi:sulfonate transport system substrate-binding protein